MAVGIDPVRQGLRDEPRHDLHEPAAERRLAHDRGIDDHLHVRRADAGCPELVVRARRRRRR
ncbi:hypothetical protein Q9Q99_03015 [Curtobacterium flaccumfaciens]|nr:hypothetical protein Q9Q99_03015 [Curtobacterium flaccumfaciens]